MSPGSRLMVALAMTTLVTGQATGQSGPEVEDLEFIGAEAFRPQELAAAIVTRETSCPALIGLRLCFLGIGVEESYLDAEVLQLDALRLRVYYYERGYRNAEVVAETVPEDDGVRAIFRITEGRPVLVTDVEVLGAPPEIAGERLPLRAGTTFDLVAHEAGRDTLLGRLRSSGYPRAQVLLGARIRAEAPYQATVTYDVVPGTRARIGEIAVEGTSGSTPDLARRMLTFEEGDFYDRGALLESQRNLYGLQIYRHAEVRADLEAEPDTLVPVTVQVVEGTMRRVRFGGGLNTLECGNVEGRWTSRNFLGGGRRFEVRARVGNLLVPACEQYLDRVWTLDQAYDSLTGHFSADFTQPWFFGPRNNIGGGLFVERRSLPEVFVRSAVGGYVSVGRTLGRGAAATLAFRPELTELRTEGDLFFCVSFIACAFEDIQRLREPHWLAPLTLTVSVDRRDAVFTPSSGFVVRGDVEHAAPYTGSDFAYTRLLGEGSRYLGDAGGVVLATRIRGGIAWPHTAGGTDVLRLNPQKRFFAGGSSSVRGFGPFRLGPTVLGIDAARELVDVDDPATPGIEGAGCTVDEVNDGTCDAGILVSRPGAFDARPAGGEVLLEGNVEVRFPLPIGGGKLRGAAFLDGGQVWGTAGAVALNEVVATPGVGIRYFSPVGPIRVDAGFNLQGPRSLPVLTTRVEPCTRASDGCINVERARTTVRNTDEILRLEDEVEYQPYTDGLDTLSGWLQRFQLHFSIGQAF